MNINAILIIFLCRKINWFSHYLAISRWKSKVEFPQDWHNCTINHNSLFCLQYMIRNWEKVFRLLLWRMISNKTGNEDGEIEVIKLKLKPYNVDTFPTVSIKLLIFCFTNFHIISRQWSSANCHKFQNSKIWEVDEGRKLWQIF